MYMYIAACDSTPSDKTIPAIMMGSHHGILWDKKAAQEQGVTAESTLIRIWWENAINTVCDIWLFVLT